MSCGNVSDDRQKKISQNAITACEWMGRGAIAYFGLRASHRLFLAGAVAGVGYRAAINKPKEVKRDHVHLGCGDAVERLSGVKQPTILKVTLMTTIFLYHMDHSLMHKFNLYIPAGGYLIGCWAADNVIWLREKK